jgi:hypothetical protein
MMTDQGRQDSNSRKTTKSSNSKEELQFSKCDYVVVESANSEYEGIKPAEMRMIEEYGQHLKHHAKLRCVN